MAMVTHMVGLQAHCALRVTKANQPQKRKVALWDSVHQTVCRSAPTVLSHARRTSSHYRHHVSLTCEGRTPMAGQPSVPDSRRDEDRKLRRPSVRGFFSVAAPGMLLSLIRMMNGYTPEQSPRSEVGVTSGTSKGGLIFHRSAYHFQPARNWINDPNGPMFYKGLYHLFYQYNPGGATWGNLTWGHAVSENLVDWLTVKPSLVCDQWYDAGGVWSGSATICPDGTPITLYTGVQEDRTETQNVALPVDPTDPYLRKWAKIPENPILRHPEGVHKEDFRDPTSAWQLDDGSWRMTVGTQFGTHGTALLYRSDDLVHWDLMERRLRAVPDTGMWGCLDFVPVPSVGQAGTLGEARPQGEQRQYQARLLRCGLLRRGRGSFTPTNPDLDVVYALQYDHGKFYSFKSFYDPVKQRRINWGWSNESDTQAHDRAKGWASVLGVPRTIWLDSGLDDNLIQAPVEELESLRSARPVSGAEVELEAAGHEDRGFFWRPGRCIFFMNHGRLEACFPNFLVTPNCVLLQQAALENLSMFYMSIFCFFLNKTICILVICFSNLKTRR